MAATLSTIRTQLEQHLDDIYHLVYTSDALGQSLRAALSQISQVSGHTLTLSGLDSATETTLPETDEFALLIGGVAHALRMRSAGAFKSLPQITDDKAPALPDLATVTMAQFQILLDHIRRRTLQESPDPPYAPWDWHEGSGF